MAAQSDLHFTAGPDVFEGAEFHLSEGLSETFRQDVPDITTVMHKKHALTLDYEQRVTNPHETRKYCVQAGDSFWKRIYADLPRAEDYS